MDNSIKWATVTTNGTLPATLSGSVINKPNVTDQDVNNIPIVWNRPAKYDETAETGEYLPTFALGSGYYMDEQLLKDLNGRQPFATLKWKVPKATSAGDTGVVKSYPQGSSTDTFNVVGSASKFGSEIRTCYNNQGWHLRYKVDSSENAFNFSGQMGKEIHVGNNVYYKIELPPAGGNNYVNMKVTVINRDSANHNVGLACGTDVQIGSNASGGSSWTAHYWDSGKDSSYTGTQDSALTFSWQNRQLKPGDSIVFSAWFGVGTPANEPILNQSTSKATITSNGTAVSIDGRVADDSGRQLTLYYTFDKGMEGESNELRLNSTPVTATGRSSYVPIEGTVEKPLNWIEGEYHTVTIQAFNEGGMPSAQKTIALVVEKDEEGNEILVFAEDATVRFAKGTGSGYSVNGAPPANIAAHKLEPITLPKTTMTATNGYKFVGWEYKGTIYPAENQFTVDEKDVTLTAKWIPGNQIMYYVDTYEMDTASTYTKVGSVMQIEASGANPIVYTPAERNGFTVDTSRSTLSIPAQDNKHIEVYYARNTYTVTFHSGSAPGIREPFSQQNNVRHGTTVTGIPTAGQLSGRQDAKYFNFGGWFTEPNGEGVGITGDTLVTSDIDAYPKWVPVIGSAQITFDYNYANHAQGVSRKDQIELTPVYHEHVDGDHADGEYRYNYGAKVGQTPATPSSWKNTEGKIFGFVDWVLVDSNGQLTNTVVSRGDEFKNFESVTVKATWQEAYEVATSWIGNGKVNTNARITADGKPLPFGKGDNAMVTWEANPGNSVKHVYIDGELRDELIRDGGCFFDNIQENHTVYVIFGAGSGSEEETTQSIYTITTEGVGCAFTNPSSGHERVTAGTNYTVTWKGASGYKLSSVTVNGMPISVAEDATSFTFSGIRRNQNIKVEYVRDTTGGGGGTTIVRGPYRIETKIINGAGITEPQTVNYNQNCTISWSVPYGFMVSQVLINHVAMNPKPTGNSYTFRNVIQNGSVEVLCVRDPNIPVVGVVVSTTIANGSITPTTDIGLLHKGDNHTVEWSASSGYYVSQILIDDVPQGETVNGEFRPAIFYSYTFEDIQEDHRIEVKCLPITSGEDDPAPALHHIETGMVKGGVIDHPSDLPDHSDVTITWTLAANHRVVKVLLDGQEVLDGDGNIPNGTFTLNNITADHEFQVVCERIPTGGGDDHTENKHKVTTTINYGTADGQKLVEDGNSCTVNWAPPAGYHVTKVEVNGVEQAYLTGNSWTLDSVTADVTVNVTCAADTVPDGDTPSTPQVYYLVPEIVNGGSVTGGGTLPITKDGRLNWTVANGYHVTGVYLDDVPLAIADGVTSYTFSHTKAAAGTTYHFKIVCDLIAYYHVRTSGTGISSITTSADPLYGEEYKVTWTVADGYRLKEVTLNGAPIVVDGNAFTFTKENTEADGTYNLDVVCERIASYTVTTGKSGMGTVSPSKTLNQGDENYEVTWTPDPGYRVKSVTVNGAAYTGDSYIFKYEDGGNATVRVEFEAIQYYTVTTSKQNVQEITPAFGKYQMDEDCTVTWTPIAGYHLTAVKVDGALQSFTEDQTSYTFDHSTAVADHTYLLEVIYERDPVEEPPENPTYTVTTVVVGNGSISDSKTLTAADETYPVTWSAAEGWQIKSITVDDVVYAGSDYTFAYNDHKDVTVKVEFEEIQHYYVTISAQNVHTIRQVKASGKYTMAEDSTVVWTPMDGYHLTAIKVDGVLQSFTEDQTSYTFDHSAVLAEHEYRFEVIYERDASGETPEDPEYTVMTTLVGSGTVSPAKTLTKAGENYEVSWSAIDGWHIKNVTIDGVGLTDAEIASGSYTFLYDTMNGDVVVRVVCERDETVTPPTPEPVYTITTESTGSGFVSRGATLKQDDEDYTIVWSAADGWHVKSVTVDGNAYSGENYVFSYDMKKDVVLSVEFEQDAEYTINTQISAGGTISEPATLKKDSAPYTVAYDTMSADVLLCVTCEEINPPEPPVGYTVSTQILPGNGVITDSGRVDEGDSYPVTWTAPFGYQVSKVEITVNGVTTDVTAAADGSYTFENITSNCAITVTCEQQPTGGEGEEPEGTYYNVVAGITGGSIDGTKNEPVDIANPGNSYKLENIQSDYLVEVACKPVETGDAYSYDVETKISNGTINGPFIGKKKNDVVTVQWTAADGYQVERVIIDGIEKSELRGKNEAQIPIEADDHTVEVICSQKNPVTPPSSGTENYMVKTFLYGGRGEITPWTGSEKGGDVPIQWKVSVDNHYKVSKVYVDGLLTPVSEDNVYTFQDILDNHTLEVYLEENLVEVVTSYEGEGTVSPSRTMFWGESYGVVKGIPAPGYRLESVIVNGVALAEGETIDELLPKTESGGGIMRKAVRKIAARLAEQDAEEYPYQNQFYFDTVKQTQTIHYVFVPESGTPVYAPYGVSVNLIGGSGLPDASKKVAVGADTSIGWTVDADYYVERITAVRNGLETEIDALNDINLSTTGNSAELTNVQTDTVINVYLKRGTMPSKEDVNDFSLSIDIVGPGSTDPNNWVEGEGVGMPAGDATAKWHIAPGHRVTMVTVDGVIREDLLSKDQVQIPMKKEDTVRDHHVIVYLDGEILPGLEKKAGENPATVDDVIPYTITVWNETDEAIWKNVTLTDKISEGLDMDVSTLKLYRVDSDGNKTEVTGAKTAYDAATRTVTSQVGDIGKDVKYELSFSARVTEAAVLNDIAIGNSVKATGSVSGDPDQIVEKETNLVYPGGVESVIPKTPKPNIVKTVESSDPSSSNTHVGDILTYTIDVWNGESGSVWKNVQVRDSIPEGLELFTNQIEVLEVAGDSRIPMQDRAKVEYDEANRILSASLGDLLYGGHYLLIFKVRVMPEAVGMDIGNVGQVAGNAPDKTLAQAETDPIYPKELDTPEKGGVQPSGPKPVITKTANNLTQSDGQSQIGDIIEYVITVKNDQFGSTWKNVVVRDRIPEGQQIAVENIILRTADGDTVLDPAVYNEESRLISIYLGDIGYEQSYQIVFTAEITGSMRDYDIGNIAWANGKNPLEPGGEDPIPGTDDETKPGDPYFNPDDDWVDEGGTVTDKVYPSPEDHHQHAGPYVVKKSHNTMHPNGETQFGDIVEYEIEIGNTAENSKWAQVCIVDTLPKELKPDLSQILLIHPDGTVEKQRGLAAYDEKEGTITVRLSDSIRDGENYWLRYRARVAEVGGETPAEIVNKVTVTGEDYDGKMLRVDAQSAISYPKPVPVDPENPSDIGNLDPEDPSSGVGVKTGDDRNLTKYVFLMVTSATLCGGITVYGKKKEKKNKKS